MDCDTLYRLLDASKQSIPSDYEAKRLFHASVMKVDTMSLYTEPQKIASSSLVSEHELEACLSSVETTQISFFFLRVQDSWSRIQISFRGFSALMRHLNVFSPFWACIQGFGLKFEPEDEYNIDYRSRFSINSELKSRVGKLEICYTVRYFDKNNRPNTKALWSERQVAIYHCFDIVKTKSVWIIVQTLEDVKSGIRGFLSSVKEHKPTSTDHLNLHLLFFLELAGNWRAYINFLEAQLVEMDEKALHSKVGSPRKQDYSVTFKDTQNLELIRRKLVKASLILKTNADVGKNWKEDMEELGKRVPKFDPRDGLEVIKHYITSLERNARVVDSILDRLNGTSKLLFQMLEYRNDELNIWTNMSIRTNGGQLRAIAEQSIAGNDLMTTLTKDIQTDSKFIKRLTFIAMLYTPISLMATIFSSNLVQVVAWTEIYEPTHMVLTSDFWKFPLLTIALLIVTLLPALGWQKYWPIVYQRIINWM